MRRPGRWKRRLLRVIGGFFLLIALLFGYLAWVSHVSPPKVEDETALSWQRQEPDSGLYTIGNSWFRHSNSGLYEMYVEGKPFERGVVNGKLSEELVKSQEDYFSEQINKMIPSDFYRHFLRYFIGWFNRDLPAHVSKEYKEEIYGVSRSASDNYGYIGNKYQRILNYHSAHDIGHALQNLALVGCTSFGTWGVASADSSLIIGRNFDFYVGDNFAKNKIVLFEAPDSGYKFMSVTWGGFIGVVSGMNEKGLTVTINAAKSDIPTGAATPVSLVAREILQYAANISDAIRIAKSRNMFVSESFLVGSAADHKAVLIEKTPDSLDVYDPGSDRIFCTNHFQGKELGASEKNKEQLAESASPYRLQRLTQLLDSAGTNTVEKTISILRDTKGLDGKNIGLGNEKAVNQLIAHHSIVFEPEKLKVWVSTSNWQLGPYVAYDLNEVFALRGMKKNQTVNIPSLTVPADSLMYTPAFHNFLQFRRLKQREMDHEQLDPDSLIMLNPNFYNAYVLAGDYAFRQKEYKEAITYYQEGLTKVVASVPEKKHMEERIAACKKKLTN